MCAGLNLMAYGIGVPFFLYYYYSCNCIYCFLFFSTFFPCVSHVLARELGCFWVGINMSNYITGSVGIGVMDW